MWINQMKPAAQQKSTLENRMGKLLKEKIDRGETGINAGKRILRLHKEVNRK